MKYLNYFFFIVLIKSNLGLAQTKAVNLVWHKDTSDFTGVRSLPFGTKSDLMQIPNNVLNSSVFTLFSYTIHLGDEKIYLNCNLTINSDSVLFAIDKNFDSNFQYDEIWRYTVDQFKSESLRINFSIKKPGYDETFFVMGSLKKSTSLKINIPDSILNINPLYLQSKNYWRSSFIEGGKMYYVILHNVNTCIGVGKNFRYLVTQSNIVDSDFLKINDWLTNRDTILINEVQGLVSTYEKDGTIGFKIIKANNLVGTYLGAIMPKATVLDVENSILQFPLIQKGQLHLIEFWGTWCGPCIALYPRLRCLLSDNSDLITYTGIAGSDEKEKVLIYIQDKTYIKRQVFEPDENKSIVGLFRIEIYPTFILIDDSGTIIAREYGTIGFEAILKKINEIKSR